MKLYFILLLILTGSLTSYAQTNIEGIGLFKIGQTKSTDLPLLSRTLGFETVKILSNLDEIPKGDSAMNIVSSLCPNAEIYYIKRSLLDGILVNNIYLTFYQGQLISFHCDGSTPLLNLFRLRYGKSQTTLINGAKSSCGRQSTQRKTLWQNTADQAVFIESMEVTSYNNRCIPVNSHSILIGNGALTSEAIECNTMAVVRLKERIDQEKGK